MSVKITKAEPTQKPAEKAAAPQGKVSFIQKVLKGDTYLVMAASEYFPEDEFQGLYFSVEASNNRFVEPPFDLKLLADLPGQNNTLGQCIEAMEVNIDGTGHEFESADSTKEPPKAEVERLSGFFDEPYPGVSFVTMRRSLRRDIESCGWGVLEVLRNLGGDLVALRHVRTFTLRYVKLDEPVEVEKTIFRDGKAVTITVMERERRFAQKVGHTRYRYFREYGASRHLNRETGEWETKDKPVPPNLRATELLVFKQGEDTETPYGQPRWINQLPSVYGSRKAEEHILEFFDSGGMPPALIFIEGGTLAKDMGDQLKMYLSGAMKNKHRAAVVEAQSSSGTLDSSGKVSVKVERFGADAAKDAMFQGYDKSTGAHVREGFRLPPLFIGQASDYNYASAQVSYMIGEAQVFAPERQEFDEVINLTIMRELKAKGVKFKSKPVTLKNVEMQIRALALVKDVSKGPGFIEEANKVVGLNLEYQKPADPVVTAIPRGSPATNGGKAVMGLPKGQKRSDPGAIIRPTPGEKKKIRSVKMLELARDYLVAEGILPGEVEATEEDRETIRKAVDELEPVEKDIFVSLITSTVQDIAVTQ